MPSRKYMANGLPSSRTPSPPESFESTSSTTSYYSATSNPSPPSSPLPSKTIPVPPSMYSTNLSKLRRISPPQTVLGAIDENSGAVQPDVPLSANKEAASPITKLHAYASAPNCRKKPTIASASSPPQSEFDFLIGPNGERFTDLRMNRKMDPAKTRGVLKRLVCFG
ncbi:hypothetical protein LTR99_005910 [Exophiala xenobiotica]|uniref:Uncharacterized protein n=1 Tax=Vermiconidia calcicola TaxID=1690605 RepID=A0AAV9QGB6_9PEZI|nr:hypothetical protein H2202_000216 [Exophiala xenobiotica]KAK5541016.1 hypothetical protein LTR25_002793 [Vermiconidia calcicola]KAK5549491.1 hypothetical protein LTR23_000599 [Chaetothyriales sp. CCFEE 6169]KAK5193859.1 hypothetical protein LTR92_006199 [Exophiala xenobiotica]KAK5208113.1 hypothetical protein LTR41_006049 [Exophiala xenobiotica]